MLTSRKEFEVLKTSPSHTKFFWECKKGHTFWRTPAKITQGIFCPMERKKKPWTYERLRKLAKKKEGKFITTRQEYEKLKKIKAPNRTEYKWSCKEGHIWNARPDSILAGTWCPVCSPSSPLTYEDMVKLARDIGIKSIEKPGKFLTPKTVFEKKSLKSKTKFLWQCGEKHDPWKSTPSNIKLGRWCPICAEGTSERITRYIFESIFKTKFPKSTPKWLKKFSGRNLHLDGYNERLKLAFEFNGIQHYKPIYGYKKLKKQRENDQLKIEACEANKVVLIIIPYNFDGREDFVDYDKMQDFIIEEYERITRKKLPRQPKYDYRTRDIKRLDEF